MRIAQNVEMLELPGNNGIMHPLLMWEGPELILVDCGLPGQLDALRAAVAQAGWALGQITRLILTHQDIDHIGCARDLSRMGARILAHREEIPYIQGDLPLIKLSALEKRLTKLSDEELEFYNRLKSGVAASYVKVNLALKDGDIIPVCGGLEVIHTPGHTPGHIALYLRGSGILICGDGGNIENGAWVGANPQHTQDVTMAEASFSKLRELNPRSVICYHGGYLPLAAI